MVRTSIRPRATVGLPHQLQVMWYYRLRRKLGLAHIYVPTMFIWAQTWIKSQVSLHVEGKVPINLWGKVYCTSPVSRCSLLVTAFQSWDCQLLLPNNIWVQTKSPKISYNSYPHSLLEGDQVSLILEEEAALLFSNEVCDKLTYVLHCV